MRFCLQCGVPLPAAVTAGTSSPIQSSAASSEVAPGPPPTRPAPSELLSGASVLPAQELSPPRPASLPNSTIPLRTSTSPMVAPREDVPLERRRANLGRNMVEFDEEALKKASEMPLVQGGTVLCRFCKGPLHLEGDFCEQCGAPVADAAPPGTRKPQAPPAPPEGPPVESAPASIPLNADVVIAPTPPDFPTPAPAPPSGFVGRLKGLFKKD